jgi:hypothetical protein
MSALVSHKLPQKKISARLPAFKTLLLEPVINFE